MADRRTVSNERKAAAPGGAHGAPDERGPAPPAARPERPISAREADPRRGPTKFGAAADGWDAYNSWLDRVRQPTPPSRQAVIAKALYSLSSYKNWADKARGAFDAGGNAQPGPGSAGNKGK